MHLVCRKEFVGRLPHRDFTGELLLDVLQRWKEEKGRDATGEVLHAALGDIRRVDLAWKIKE